MEENDFSLAGPRKIGSPPEPHDDPPLLPGIREEEQPQNISVATMSTMSNTDNLQSEPTEHSSMNLPSGHFPGMLASPPPGDPPEDRPPVQANHASQAGRDSLLSSPSPRSLAEDFAQQHHAVYQEYLEGVKQRLCEAVVSEINEISKQFMTGAQPQPMMDCRTSHHLHQRSVCFARQTLRNSIEARMQSEYRLKSVMYNRGISAPELPNGSTVAEARKSSVRYSIEASGLKSLDRSEIFRTSMELDMEPEMTKISDTWELHPCWVVSEQDGDQFRRSTVGMMKTQGTMRDGETHIDYDMNELEWAKRQNVRRVHRSSEEDPEYSFIQDENCFSRNVISPFNTARLLWDLVGVLCIGYDTLSLPLQFLELEEGWFTIGMRWYAMIFWLLDILLNFYTGHIDHSSHRVEMRPSEIAKHYLRTWFFLDVIIVLPDWIIFFLSLDSAGVTRLGKVIRVLRALRALRLLRLGKLRRLLHILESTFNNEYLTCYFALIKIMVSVALLTHILGCFWFGMSRVGEDDEGWVAKFEYGGNDRLFQYLTSLHWALCLFQGTMEVFPVTRSERAFAVVVQFIGLIIVSYFISSITHFMTEIRIIHDTIVQRRSHLVRFLSDMNISPELSLVVKQFADKVSRSTSTTEDEVEILGLLPDQMKKDLDLEIKGPSLGVHPLLNNLIWNSKPLARKFVEHMCHISMHYSETLFRRGEDATQMYFLMIGSLVYDKAQHNGSSTTANALNSSSAFFHRLATVEPTDWLCEMSIWTTWVHRGLLMARAHCEVFALPRDKFADLTLTMGNDMSEAVYRHGRIFINWVNEQVNKNVDDLTHMPAPAIKRRKHGNLFGATGRLSLTSRWQSQKNMVSRFF